MAGEVEAAEILALALPAQEQSLGADLVAGGGDEFVVAVRGQVDKQGVQDVRIDFSELVLTHGLARAESFDHRADVVLTFAQEELLARLAQKIDERGLLFRAEFIQRGLRLRPGAHREIFGDYAGDDVVDVAKVALDPGGNRQGTAGQKE